MLYKAAYLVVAALSALTVVAGPVQERNTHITTLKPPQLIPFAHIALKVEDSTYVNETNGIQTGQANNQGGNITGAITGKVLKLGTEFETFPTAANLSESTYDNRFTVNTTDGVALFLLVSGNIHYKLPHLHGFARLWFETSSPKYQKLAYGDFVAEFEAVFPSGKVSVDIFELKSSGDY